MDPEIVTIPIPCDNYAYCIVSGSDAIVVDASEERPIADCIDSRRLSLHTVLSTHHHGDHTGGNIALKKKTGCTIAGGDKRIAGIDHIVNDHKKISEGLFTFESIATPGHTSGSMAFYFKELSALFTGDTLFYAGCGRLFEGTASQLFGSLQKISTLPLDTKIYCGHEYTLENLRFAKPIEPDNAAIENRITEVRKLLDKGRPSGPSTLKQELATNPFLRVERETVRASLGLPDAPPEIVFAELRKRKDRF